MSTVSGTYLDRPVRERGPKRPGDDAESGHALTAAAVEALRAGVRGEVLAPARRATTRPARCGTPRRPAPRARRALRRCRRCRRAVDFARSDAPRGRAGRGPQRGRQRGLRRGPAARPVADEGRARGPARRTARAEPGLTWGEFDRETQAFGLATTGGICSEAGIAGVTLGGGFGWLMRRHGLAVDNLLSVDVVGADGRLRTASATEHADLFFGVRGARSNFGVVTSLEYRLHPVGPDRPRRHGPPPPGAGPRGAPVLPRLHQPAPDELSAWAALLTSPDGHPMVAILACYSGPAEAGEDVLRPLRTFGPPVADLIRPMPYVAAQALIDGASRGAGSTTGGRVCCALSATTRSTRCSAGSGRSRPVLECADRAAWRGGGPRRSRRTAFRHRDAPYDLVIMPMWTDPGESETHRRWADALWRAMQPAASGGVYVNYLGDEGEERVKAAYGDGYERLVAVKNAYDPTNLFRFNQNIRPTGWAPRGGRRRAGGADADPPRPRRNGRLTPDPAGDRRRRGAGSQWLPRPGGALRGPGVSLTTRARGRAPQRGLVVTVTRFPQAFGISVTVEDTNPARRFSTGLYAHDRVLEGVFGGIPT